MMLIKRASAALVIATMFGLSTAIAQTTPAPIKAPPKQLPAIEQGALDIVKAMSAKLAGAKTLHFQVRVQSEAPSIDGIAVIYTSNSEFTLQRPNKLTAVRTGQGNPSELIYDGQSVAVITPNSNLVAFSKAPGNIDAMAQFIFEKAGIYFPGGMILLSDPYANITSDLRAAFVVEKSKLVGGAVIAAPPYAPPAPIVEYGSVPPIGSIYPVLPAGCVLAPRNDINFYQCAGYRVRPLYGQNGLHYRVVPE